MQNLNLIKILVEPVSKLQAYIKKTRGNAATALSVNEIAKIVEEVRIERYAKKYAS